MTKTVSLDSLMEPDPPAQSQVKAVGKPVSLQQAMGQSEPGLLDNPPSITEYLTEGQVDPKTGQETREGLFANLKNPLHLWMKDSLPANLFEYLNNRKALQFKATTSAAEESQDKNILANPNNYPKGWVSAAEARQAEREARKFSFSKIAEAAQSDPGKFGAEFVNAIVVDPVLALTPWGFGGGLSRAAAATGRKAMGSAGAAAGRVGGRAVEGGAMGVAVEAPISVAEQLSTEGRINPSETARSMAMTGALSGAFGALLGKTTKPRIMGPAGEATPVPGKPRLKGPVAIAELVETKPQGTGGPDGIADSVIAGVEPTVLPVAKPRLKGPPGQIGAVGDLEAAKRRKMEMDGLIEPEPEPGLPPKLQVPVQLQVMGVMAGGSAGALAVAEYVRRRDLEEERWKQIQDGTENPEPTDEGTFLAKNPEWLMGPVLVGMAVKGKGGMWHPEAIQRLAAPLERVSKRSREQVEAVLKDQPIKYSDEVLAEVKADKAGLDWSEKAIRNYLNRYAGTAEDPLKDVEIPFGEGTKRWEELTDAAIRGKDVIGPRGPEIQWDIPKMLSLAPEGQVSAESGRKAIESQLSHVGDYLRQNVPPEKLGQYDLVRAVKETAAHDLKMAKAAEKAALGSMKDLPVYKDYGDGFRWVELRKPKKLTEEQAKGVRAATTKDNEGATGDQVYKYVATDATGKPIVNNYTKDVAGGRTPEEAYLAGQLAQEGNTMGHCVGGYCESVASGESKIYSLRDAKGRSHVTVEVESRANRIRRNSDRDEYYRARNATKGDLSKLPDDIVQIKGKGNRAPVSEYLPYVQDFVRSGKWGEVGDLENTGLVKVADLKPEVQADVKRFVGDNPYVTHAELDDVIQKRLVSQQQVSIERGELPRGQDGKVDPTMLFSLAALGLAGYGGAALDKDSPLRGAGAGIAAAVALGMSGKVRKALGDATVESLKGLDYGLGMISTRIKNISPALHHAAIEYERNILKQTHDALTKVDPFLVALNKVKDPALNRALLTNDADAINARLKELKNPALSQGWLEVRKTLVDLGTQLQGKGRFKDLKPGYFPRIVTDRAGLLKALGGEAKTRLETKLLDGDTMAIKSRGTGLTQVEQSIIINRFLQENTPSFGQPRFAKKRSVKEVTEDLEPFYATPTESLHSYIRAAVKDLEGTKFFGKNLREKIKGNQTFTDVDKSIGEVVRRELEAGRIDGEGAQELQSMLRARFISGERPTTGIVQDAKNMANAGLLGNIVSAGTQLGDAFISVYSQGLRPTLKAIGQLLTGRKHFGMNDFGLADHISEEFVSTRKSAKFLNAMFKYSGFSAIDRLGKNTVLNAAVNKGQLLARSASGVEKLRKMYEPSFGAKFPELVNDLRNKKITDLVESMAFQELSRTQPITKLESPQGKLELQGSPTKDVAATAYMLKSFMLKQLDVVRRDAYNEIKKGNIAKGFANLTKFGITLGIAGATSDQVKNWIRGRDEEFEGTDVLMNALKTFGWSEYTMEKVRAGKPAEAIAGFIAPPYRMMDDIVSRDPKAIRYIPLVGTWYYDRFMGGAEEAERNKRKRERAKALKELRGE